MFDSVSHYKYLSHIEVDWQDLNTDILSNKRAPWTFLRYDTFDQDYSCVFHLWYSNSQLGMEHILSHLPMHMFLSHKL